MKHDPKLILEKDEQELLVMIGRELTHGEVGAVDLTPKQLADRAMQWLRGLITRVRPDLCGSPAVKAIRDKSDTIALVGAIVDVISKFCGVVSPATVAVLLVRMGLKKVCADIWEQQNGSTKSE